MNTPPRKKRNSTKINLVISAVFHTVIIGALFYFAAREGFLGKTLKTIAVQMAPKEKPPEKKPEPKKVEEKPPEPKAEPKTAPKVQEVPKVAVAPRLTPAVAPPAAVAPSVAPAPVGVGNFDFKDDSATTVQSSSDPVTLYKGLVEYTLRSRWSRPENVDDLNFIAEVDLSIDPSGKITGYDWRKGSGDNKWDDSVKWALKQTAAINRAPPKNFPAKVLVRFDTQPATEAVPLFGEP